MDTHTVDPVSEQPAPSRPSLERASLEFAPRVREGITEEVLQAFNAVPRRGAEVGGILLGRREADQIVVEDFEPVLCEHRFGPSYLLDDADRRGFEETLEWFRGRAECPAVLGFYRSHTRAAYSLDEQDSELFAQYFPEGSALFLLLRPDKQQNVTIECFTRYEGVLRAAAPQTPFSQESAIELSTAPPPRTAPQLHPRPRREYDAPVALPPPTRPRLLFAEEAEPRRRSYRQWLAIAALAGLGAVLYGVTVWPSAPPPPDTVSLPRPAAPTQAAAPIVARAVPAAAANRVAEEKPGPTENKPASPTDVRATLDRWVRAQRSGNAKAVAALYAPHVERYLRERDVSNAFVRYQIGQGFAHQGKPVILRLDDVQITPQQPDRATVTFRKHWQSAGPRVASGDSEERLGLVKTREGWKIDYEQESHVLWTRAR